MLAPMFGLRHHSDHRVSLAFLLAALVVLFGGAGCGEDVLVGRWTLRADLPDASPGAPDAGPDSNQAESADRARRHAEQQAKEEQDGHNEH
jgi:hypothetical protein